MTKVVKALVVEDEKAIQSILAAFLNRFVSNKGLKGDIRTISDPVEGLFELSTNGEQYAAILLDVRLPKLGGDEIYNSLEAVNPELLGRVIFVTGYPDDLAQRFPDRELSILEKPFRYESLAEKLEDIFAGQ